MAALVRHQVLAAFAILGFTAAFGASIFALRAALGAVYAAPACEAACAKRGARVTDIDYRVGKRDNHSFCVCSDAARIETDEAGFVANASVLGTIVLTVGVTGAGAWWLARRARTAT